MKYFVGLMALVAVVAGVTYGAYYAWDQATHTRDDNGGVIAGGASSAPPPVTGPLPAPGQVAVTGTVTGAHLEGVALDTLPTPFTVTASNRGTGGATFTPVQVKGKTTSIDWQTGQPLPIKGDGGALKLGPVVIDAGGGTITIVLDGVHGVAPGTYSLNSSVAVGSQPLDSVTFTATDKTTVEFRGGITTQSPTPNLATKGTGNVALQGSLTIEHPDGTTTTASSIALDNGIYEIKLDPTPDGNYTVTATLQGNVH